MNYSSISQSLRERSNDFPKNKRIKVIVERLIEHYEQENPVSADRKHTSNEIIKEQLTLFLKNHQKRLVLIAVSDRKFDEADSRNAAKRLRKLLTNYVIPHCLDSKCGNNSWFYDLHKQPNFLAYLEEKLNIKTEPSCSTRVTHDAEKERFLKRMHDLESSACEAQHSFFQDKAKVPKCAKWIISFREAMDVYEQCPDKQGAEEAKRVLEELAEASKQLIPR